MPINPDSIRIAVVDDEDVILNVVASLMRQHKYHTDLFPNPKEALRAISAHPKRYDLLVSDIYMGGEDGITFAKEVRSVLPDLPILFMTGNESEEIKNKALSLGRVAFLAKPFPLIETLGEIVSKFLQEKE